MNNPKFYSMIGQLEDKRRMLLETLVYGALLLSVVASIADAAVQPIIMPGSVQIKTVQTEHRA
jgi:hypothetical protein